jgi:hypothetical protein
MQLALEAQPIRAAPNVGEVELKMRILHDAERVLKVLGTATL